MIYLIIEINFYGLKSGITGSFNDGLTRRSLDFGTKSMLILKKVYFSCRN